METVGIRCEESPLDLVKRTGLEWPSVHLQRTDEEMTLRQIKYSKIVWLKQNDELKRDEIMMIFK